MKSACSSSAPGAFATPSAGFGYFATAEHYRHLAKAAGDALHRGGVVLVSGDPPVCLAMLIEALRNAATPRAVIAISCGPALDFSALYAGGGSPPQGQATPGSAQDGATGPTVLPFPIYVFDDADRLSDLQIEALLDATQAVPLNARTPREPLIYRHFGGSGWRSGSFWAVAGLTGLGSRFDRRLRCDWAICIGRAIRLSMPSPTCGAEHTSSPGRSAPSPGRCSLPARDSAPWCSRTAA
jgi:hypothetical protein